MKDDGSRYAFSREEKKIFRHEYEKSFDLPEEYKPVVDTRHSFIFSEKGLHGQWLAIEAPDGKRVEGALYKSTKPHGEVILFFPGMPGDATSWFEEQHVSLLNEAGYDVFVGRHNGMKVHDPVNTVYIHNTARMGRYDEFGSQEETIGGKPMDFDGVISEPRVAMEYFSGQKMSVITHSFSGLSMRKSLEQLSQRYSDKSYNPAKQVKKWLNLAGVNYTDFNAESWKWYAENVIARHYAIDDTAKIIEQISTAVKQNSDEIVVPSTLSVISVIPEKDPYVSTRAGADLQKSLKKGVVVVYNIEGTEDDGIMRDGRSVHDYIYRPEALKKLLTMVTSQETGTYTVHTNKSFI